MSQAKNRFIPDLKSKPYTLLGIVAVLMAIVSFAPIGNEALDMQLHDTYIVIANFSFYRLFAAILLFLWAVYIVANRFMFSLKLTRWHVILTLLSIIVFMMLNSHRWGLSGVPRRYYAINEFENSNPYLSVAWSYIICILVFLIGQIVFGINLTIGIVQYFRRPGPENKNRL